MLVYQALILVILLLIAGLVRRNCADYRRPEPRPWDSPEAPFVSILVPARNEAANIEACLSGLLRQEYPRFEVVALDDDSTDGTGEIIARMAAADPRLRLERGAGLPAGWAGKTHACWQLAGRASGEWLLFVDADTRHAPDLLSAALRTALEMKADLLSTFPRQEIGTVGEAVTVPFIYWMLFTLLPIRGVWENPEPQMAAACGQFLLTRRDAYLETGGHGAIPGSLHDGLHLARLFKSQEKRVALADLSLLISCRMYRGWGECWRGFSRNAFQALGSVPALVFMSVLESALFLLPFLFLTAAVWLHWPAWAWLTAAQALALYGIHLTLRSRFGYPWTTIALHPLGIVALIGIQWRSWLDARRGRRGAWKGRVL